MVEQRMMWEVIITFEIRVLGSSVVVEREKSSIGALERSNSGARYSVSYSYSNSDLDLGSSPDSTVDFEFDSDSDCNWDLELCFSSDLVPEFGSRSVV